MYLCKRNHETNDVFTYYRRRWWRFKWGGFLACGVTRRVYFGGSGDGVDVPCAEPVVLLP